MKFINSKKRKAVRRELRNEMSEPERILWARLKGKQVGGYKFRRQSSIGSYVVDFYCPAAKLIVEADGDSHFDPSAEFEDRARDRFMRSMGMEVLRFTNVDIRNNIEGVLETIQKHFLTLQNPS